MPAPRATAGRTPSPPGLPSPHHLYFRHSSGVHSVPPVDKVCLQINTSTFNSRKWQKTSSRGSARSSHGVTADSDEQRDRDQDLPHKPGSKLARSMGAIAKLGIPVAFGVLIPAPVLSAHIRWGTRQGGRAAAQRHPAPQALAEQQAARAEMKDFIKQALGLGPFALAQPYFPGLLPCGPFRARALSGVRIMAPGVGSLGAPPARARALGDPGPPGSAPASPRAHVRRPRESWRWEELADLETVCILLSLLSEILTCPPRLLSTANRYQHALVCRTA